jgi:hypothetical protein
MLLIFNNPVYEEINLSTWLAANPASILEANFGLTKGVVDYLPRKLVGFTNPAGPFFAARASVRGTSYSRCSIQPDHSTAFSRVRVDGSSQKEIS